MINFDAISSNIEAHPVLIGSILAPIFVGLILIMLKNLFRKDKQQNKAKQAGKQSMKDSPGGSQSMMQIANVEKIIMSSESSPEVATQDDALSSPTEKNERTIELSGNSKYISEQIEDLFPGDGDTTRTNYSQALAAIEDENLSVAASLFLRIFNNIYHLFTESTYNTDKTTKDLILSLEGGNKTIQKILLPEGDLSQLNNCISTSEGIILAIMGRIRK